MKRLAFAAAVALCCAFVSPVEAAQIHIAFAGVLNDDRALDGSFWYDPGDLGSGEVMGSDIIYKDGLKNFLATLTDANSVEKVLENGFSSLLVVHPHGLGFHFDGKDAAYLYIDLVYPLRGFDPADALSAPPPLDSTITSSVAFYPGEGDAIYRGTLTSFTPTHPIPEPATWAIMVAGLGLLGAAARRQRR